MLNKNLILFNPKILTLNINNNEDKNLIEIREKNTYYNKLINKNNANNMNNMNNIENDTYFLNNNIKK
jgi:hypothetical protein